MYFNKSQLTSFRFFPSTFFSLISLPRVAAVVAFVWDEETSPVSAAATVCDFSFFTAALTTTSTSSLLQKLSADDVCCCCWGWLFVTIFSATKWPLSICYSSSRFQWSVHVCIDWLGSSHCRHCRANFSHVNHSRWVSHFEQKVGFLVRASSSLK